MCAQSHSLGTANDPSAKLASLTGIWHWAPCAAWAKVMLLPSDSLALLQESLDNLIMEGDNIVSAARKAIIRHDYSAVLTIFPILKHLKQMKPEFDQVLQVSMMGLERVLWLALSGELFERVYHKGALKKAMLLLSSSMDRKWHISSLFLSVMVKQQLSISQQQFFSVQVMTQWWTIYIILLYTWPLRCFISDTIELSLDCAHWCLEDGLLWGEPAWTMPQGSPGVTYGIQV